MHRKTIIYILIIIFIAIIFLVPIFTNAPTNTTTTTVSSGSAKKGSLIKIIVNASVSNVSIELKNSSYVLSILKTFNLSHTGSGGSILINNISYSSYKRLLSYNSIDSSIDYVNYTLKLPSRVSYGSSYALPIIDIANNITYYRSNYPLISSNTVELNMLAVVYNNSIVYYNVTLYKQ
ncbi:MAG: hypothetical protein ARM1_0171 [Candidatus Micrarchaeota archaeon]|nr:MAG: hypothetical protein ARM1_0171 [Candidatus Micrarchaeota archaeon]